MNYSLGTKKSTDSSKYSSTNNSHCKLSATASTDRTNNNNNVDEYQSRQPEQLGQHQQQIEISPSATTMTTSSSRSADSVEQEPPEQRYNRINNNHVIASVVVGSASGTKSPGAVARDECDAASSPSSEVPTTPTNVEAEASTHDDAGNESPSKAVDTRIPVYV